MASCNLQYSHQKNHLKLDQDLREGYILDRPKGVVRQEISHICKRNNMKGQVHIYKSQELQHSRY